MLTLQERDEMIERYRRGPELIRSALIKVPPEALQWRPAEGKWSVHEVVCHCADSELNAAARIRFLLADPNPTILGYDQERWARALDYHSHPIPAALATIEAVRANTVPLLRRMTEQDWARAGTHSESGRYTAETWLTVYAEHLEKHSRQIERNLESWKTRIVSSRA